MAYFSNGTDGEALENQCAICRYGDRACPIYAVQFNYNYDACNNKTARAILDELIRNDGTCNMFNEFEDDFRSQEKTDKQLTFEGEIIV